MLSKLSTQKMILALVVLIAAIAFIYYQKNSKKVGTLKTYLVQVDTATIHQIKIKPKEHDAYTLIREQNRWFVQKDEQHKFPIKKGSVKPLLGNFSSLKPMRLVANKEEKWSEFELDTEQANSITLHTSSGEEINLLVGKFSFNQQNNSMLNYVRLADENEVYTINTPLSFSINKAANTWRDGSIVKAKKTEILSISLKGESQFSITKDSSTWLYSGIQLDSAATDAYLNLIAGLNSQNFDDESDKNQLGEAKFEWQILTDKQQEIKLQLYKKNQEWLLTSSQNTDALFIIDENTVQQLVPKDAILQQP